MLLKLINTHWLEVVYRVSEQVLMTWVLKVNDLLNISVKEWNKVSSEKACYNKSIVCQQWR